MSLKNGEFLCMSGAKHGMKKVTVSLIETCFMSPNESSMRYHAFFLQWAAKLMSKLRVGQFLQSMLQSCCCAESKFCCKTMSNGNHSKKQPSLN